MFIDMRVEWATMRGKLAGYGVVGSLIGAGAVTAVFKYLVK